MTEIDLKRDMDPLTQQKETEVLQDTAWLQKRDVQIDQIVRQKAPGAS